MPSRRAWQPAPVFLPGESLRTEEPGGLWSTGWQTVGRGRAPSTHIRAEGRHAEVGREPGWMGELCGQEGPVDAFTCGNHRSVPWVWG